jgi:hypothetical protein
LSWCSEEDSGFSETAIGIRGEGATAARFGVVAASVAAASAAATSIATAVIDATSVAAALIAVTVLAVLFAFVPGASGPGD